MPRENSSESWMIVAGAIGIVALLVASLGYALRDSSTYYETEQINQFVLEQQTAASEDSR